MSLVARFGWLALVPLLVLVQQDLHRRVAPATDAPERLLWSGQQLRRMAPGFEVLLADIYWLRTVQYYGAERAFSLKKEYALLLPLVDVTVTLDPRLEIAYRYGATFLAEERPIGAGRPTDAVALLRRGVESNPGSWRLWQDLGLFQYVFLKDAQGASRALLEGAERPGAPQILRLLAASVLLRGGEHASARQLWQQIHASSEPGPMRDNAAVHLARIDAHEAVDALANAAAGYRAGRGTFPASLADLARAGYQGPTVDATGVPFDYDPRTGRATIGRRSGLWRAGDAQLREDR